MRTWFYICIFILAVHARHGERRKVDDIDRLIQTLRNLLPKEDLSKNEKNDGERNTKALQQQNNNGHGKREDDSGEKHIKALQQPKVDPNSKDTELFSSFIVEKGKKKAKSSGLKPQDSQFNKAEKKDRHPMSHEQKVQFGMESETEDEKDLKSVAFKRAFTVGRLWTKKIVPYEIDPSLNYTDALEVIEKAKEEFSSLTCVQWKPHTAELETEVGHGSYVSFFSGSGCWSYVGRVNQAKQHLSLSYPGCVGVGTAIHEMLHALGAWHEQSRTDRDLHVKLIWSIMGENLKGGANYGKFDTRDYNYYDYESIEHYGWRNGFEPLQPELGFLAYYGGQLSYYDIADITDAYRCTENCVNPVICENGGFLEFKCSCYCPYGLTGTTCNSVNNDEVCGGIIDLIPGQEVTITTPNYHNNYDVDTECVWLLRAPEEFHVRVDADVFHLPYNPDNNRCYHWLEVRYNLVGQTGVRECGDSSGESWVTTPWGEQNLMLLIFDSVYGKLHFPEKGFSLRAKAVRGGCLGNSCEYGVCKDCDDQAYRCDCDPGFEGEHCDQVKAATSLECTFEDVERCFLKNIKSDQFDWKMYSGKTVSDLTGPDEALEGENYMYAEASIPRVPGDKAILQSNVTFTAEDRCLTFYYHMFGFGIGSLRVKSASEELWSRSGNQGFYWFMGRVTIPSTDNLQIAIEAERGSDWEGDIAIDDIKLSPGECSSPVTFDCLGTALGKEYIGKVNVTKDGVACQRWDSNEPHHHSYNDYDGDENYCRNTRGDELKPWCYTIDSDNRWEFCDIPHCHIQECVRSSNGYDYMGTKTVTKQGIQCDDGKPCRASGNNPAPWCWTENHSNVRWDTCDVPKCDDEPMECLQTGKGKDYFGTVSVTETGSTCQRWDSQLPMKHDYWYLADQENYCRNPDGSKGPWCMSSELAEGYVYCTIPYCDDLGCHSNPCLHGGTCENTENKGFICQCRDGYEGITCQTRGTEEEDCKRSAVGYEYEGQINVTKSNLTCQRWELDEPRSHNFNYLPENYCRNPDKEPTPWCYTITSKRYELCDVPFCTTPPKECLESEKGVEYFGSVNQTKDGYTCQKWSEQTPQAHSYDYIKDQGNFCRNPYGGDDRPWCYTTDPNKRWQSCNIPQC